MRVFMRAVCAVLLVFSVWFVIFWLEPDFELLFVLMVVLMYLFPSGEPKDMPGDAGLCISDKADSVHPGKDAVLRSARDFSDDEKKEIVGLLDNLVARFAIEQWDFWKEVCCDRRSGHIPSRMMGRLDNQRVLFYALDAFQEIPVRLRCMREGRFDDYAVSSLHGRLGSFVSCWGGVNLWGLRVSGAVRRELDFHMCLSNSSCNVALRIRKMLERDIPAFEMDIKEDLGE